MDVNSRYFSKLIDRSVIPWKIWANFLNVTLGPKVYVLTKIYSMFAPKKNEISCALRPGTVFGPKLAKNWFQYSGNYVRPSYFPTQFLTSWWVVCHYLDLLERLSIYLARCFSDDNEYKTDVGLSCCNLRDLNPVFRYIPRCTRDHVDPIGEAWNNPKNRLCSTTTSFKSLNSDCQLSGCSLERGSSTNDGGKDKGVTKQQRWG